MLSPGEVIDGRFRIKSEIAVLPYGTKFLCHSVGEEILAEILVVTLSSLDTDVRNKLAEDIDAASRLRHKNIVPALGYGQMEHSTYLAVKTGQGRTLVEHLERRLKLGKPFERTESFSLLSHICNAIQFASGALGHGTLRTSSVVINSNGRVQIRDFGLGALRSVMEPESPWDKGCLFKHVEQVDNDLYALGVIALQLLTGQPVSDGLEVGIEADADGLHPTARRCLAKCLSPSDAGGYLSAAEFRRAIKPVFAGGDSASHTPSPQPPKPESANVSVKVGEAATTPLRKSPTLSRWLIEKDGVDFGPFNQEQILTKLYEGELSPHSVLADVESERRLTLAEYPEFQADMLQSLHKKDERETADREVKAVKKAKLDKGIKVWGSVSIVLVLALCIGAWQYIVSNRPEPVRANLSNAVSTLEWSLPSISPPEPAPPPETSIAKKAKPKSQARRRTGSSKKWSNSEKNRMAREEQMAANSTLDGERGRTAAFSRRSFDRVLAKRTPRIYRCLMAEAKARPGVQDMMVDASVMSSGAIINVKMPGGTVPGIRCIRRAFQGARIPAFTGTNKTIRLPYRLD